jgi:anti-sigma-K factor RskA
MNDLHELAALYVVDALTDDERAEYETHLLECAECRAEVADLRMVTEQLSRAVEAEPPASLRASVLAGIAGTAQDHAGDPDASAGAGRHLSAAPAPSRATATPLSSSAASRTDTVVPFRQRAVSRLPYLVAAAAVLLALGFGGWALQSRQDAQQASDRQAQLVQLLGASDVRTVSGAGPAGSTATVVISPTRQQALLVADRMPALPDGKIYEVWTISGSPSPAGTFTPGDDSAAVVTLPGSALSATQVAVTIEPAGGSEHPTSPLLMKLSLT